MAQIMKIYRLKTKKEAVNLAMRKLISEDPYTGMLALRGIGWSGDLDEMRGNRIVEF